MAKRLKLTFDAEGGSTLDVSVTTPKEGLDAAAVEQAAASLVPVLVTSDGAAVTGLKKAAYITTTEEAIVG